jgi:hypothetical protein
VTLKLPFVGRIAPFVCPTVRRGNEAIFHKLVGRRDAIATVVVVSTTAPATTDSFPQAGAISRSGYALCQLVILDSTHGEVMESFPQLCMKLWTKPKSPRRSQRTAVRCLKNRS